VSGISQVKEGVLELDGFEWGEDRFGVAETVLVAPLEVADPDDDLGKLAGVLVDFETEKLIGADLGKHTGEAVGGAEGDDLAFEIEQILEGDV
jgi:hypothetical protein